jgi:hypothetical protein
MDKFSYRKYKVGDRVTVRSTDVSYDSAPDVTPGMVGTIKAFPPKVRKVKGPLFDSGDYFAYVVFDSTYTQGGHTHQIRAGIDICNLKKVR